MACLGIRNVLDKSTAALLDDRADRISRLYRLHSRSIPNVSVKRRFQRICAVAAVVSDHRCVFNQVSSSIDVGLELANRIVNDDNEFDDRTTEISGFPDKLEEWIEGSVTEIVKNITQAPLLLKIYANGVVKTETAVKSKSWPYVVTKKSSSPDGIILVEELSENRDHISNHEVNEKDGTRAFGVLVQGKIKGRDHCKSACYLLKTSSVINGGGIGFICSHYCLMKVQNFWESASSQLNSSWLVE